jgi:hypothetical protein
VALTWDALGKGAEFVVAAAAAEEADVPGDVIARYQQLQADTEPGPTAEQVHMHGACQTTTFTRQAVMSARGMPRHPCAPPPPPPIADAC